MKKRLTGPSVLVHSGKTADWTLSTSTFGNKMHQSVHVWYLPTTVSHCLHSSDVSKSAARDQVLTSAFQITYCATLSLHMDPLRNYGINTLSRPMLACLLRAETSLQNNLNMMGSNCFSAGLGTKVTKTLVTGGVQAARGIDT